MGMSRGLAMVNRFELKKRKMGKVFFGYAVLASCDDNVIQCRKSLPQALRAAWGCRDVNDTAHGLRFQHSEVASENCAITSRTFVPTLNLNGDGCAVDIDDE